MKELEDGSWKIDTALEAVILADVLGIQRTAEDEKTARKIAQNLFKHGLSYSDVNIPSPDREENFLHDSYKAAAKGIGQLTLAPELAQEAYEKLVVASSPNVKNFDGSHSKVPVRLARLMLYAVHANDTYIPASEAVNQ